MKRPCLLFCLVAIAWGLSGCATKAELTKNRIEKQYGVPVSPANSPRHFRIARSDNRANWRFDTVSGGFCVTQGTPFRYHVSTTGVPVKITVAGGMGQKAVLDQRSGVEFDGQFTTNFSGFVDYTVEPAAEGIAEGVVTPLTREGQ